MTTSPLSPPIIIMELISWNIQGLNGHSRQRLLRDRIIVEQPDIVFLQETLTHEQKAREFMHHLRPYWVSSSVNVLAIWMVY